MHRVNKQNDSKIARFTLRIASFDGHRFFPDLAPSDFFFAVLKRMLAGNKNSTYEEVIAETEAYFQAKTKIKI